MLLPRGLSKKKVDLISVKRRRIEDKERPFRKAAGTPAAGDAISARADPTIEQIIWTNAVYICLFENVFSSDDLQLVRQPVTNCEHRGAICLSQKSELIRPEVVTCHSVALKAKLTDVAPLDLVSALRLVGEGRIQIRLALGTEEAEAGSAFEFRLLDTDGTNISENISRVAYLVRLRSSSLVEKHEMLINMFIGVGARPLSVDQRYYTSSASKLKRGHCFLCRPDSWDHTHRSHSQERIFV